MAAYRERGIIESAAYRAIDAAYRAAHALLPPSPILVTPEQKTTLSAAVALIQRGGVL